MRVILRYARAAWNLPFDLSVIDNASEVLKAEKLISKATSRLLMKEAIVSERPVAGATVSHKSGLDLNRSPEPA